MAEETEVQLAAEHFIRRFGYDAPRQAKIRAEELRAAGHADGHMLWQSIYREVKLRLDSPKEAEC